MKKRQLTNKGQVAIFIIIGIVLIAVITLIIFVLSNKTKDNGQDYSDYLSDEAYNQIQNCVERSTTTALYFNFLQGGYYQTSKPSLYYEPIEIPFYWKEGNSYFPSINILKNELSLFVEKNIGSCLGEYDSKEITVDVIILEDSFLFKFKIPISVQGGEKTVEFVDFENSINLDFNEKYQFINEFLEYQEKNKDYFPLSYLTSLAYEHNFKFEILEIDENVKVVSIILDSIDERGPLVYNFAVGYKNETEI